MTTTMKGLLKGLRYISQIFDPKEHEMQIGFPTDVKHVAHIGWDGPSVSTPSWMNEFRSAPLSATGSDALAIDRDSPARHSYELHGSGGTLDSAPALEVRDEAPPKSRRHASVGSADPPSQSAGAPPRRRRNKSDSGSSASGADSSVREGPIVPKGGRKKKAKAGDGVSTRSGKPRAKASSASSADVGSRQPHEQGSTEELRVVLSPAPQAEVIN